MNNTDAAGVRRRKIRRGAIISAAIATVVIVAGIIAVVLYTRAHQQNTLAGMVTGQVLRGDITQKISATGTVDAQTGAQVNIGSQITGRIKDLYVDIGTHVTAGQIIAVLDLPDINAQYNQSVAALAAARASSQASAASVQAATAALQTARQVYAQQVSGVSLQQTTTTTDIRKAQAGLASAQATYNQDAKTAGAQVAAAQAAVNQAQATYTNAVTFLNREKALLVRGYVAKQDVDNAQAQANVAAAQLDSAVQNLALVRTKTATALQTDQAAVQNAEAVLAAARAETAQNTIKAQQVAAAQAAVQQAQAVVQQAQASYQQSLAAIQQAQANVAFELAQYNKTIIRTPITGTVTTLSAQQGETVAAGLSAPTLVTVVNLDRLQVNAYVDETDIGSVRIGQPALITVDAYPNQQFTGQVVKIAAGGTLQQNVVTYDTTIALANPKGLLKPSMSATVSITVKSHRNVALVPIEAVKYIGTTPVVYVVDSNKNITAHPVVTGISDDTNTEILRGVQVGDIIVLAGYPPSGTSPRISIFGPGTGGGGAGRSGGGGGGAGRSGGGGGRGGR